MILNLFFIPDVSFFWLMINIGKIKRIIKTNSIELLIVSNSPSAYILAAILKNKLGIKFVIDFADKWVGNPGIREYSKLHRMVQTKLENWVVRKSSGFTFVSKHFESDYNKKYPNHPKLLLQNGYDPEDFSTPVPEQDRNRNVITFLHFGSIYDTMNIEFAYAFAQAISRNPSMKNMVRLKIIGKIGKKRFLELCGLRENCSIEILPQISHSQLIMEIHNCDILVFSLSGKLSHYDTVPSRLAEYLGSGKPVIACCVSGSEIERICRECGCWRIVDFRNISDIAKAFEDALIFLAENRTIPSWEPNYKGLAEIRWDIIVDKFNNFLEAVTR
jgi:glycosyltransferase involved in cell wall biosynthesis